LLILGLAACQPAQQPVAGNEPLAQGRVPDPPTPPPAPGPNFGNGSAIAVPGIPDTNGLDDAQIDAMFDAAVARARPGESKRAICVGMQGLADGAVKDAPEATIRRLAELLRLPTFPASQCRADVYPFVTATKAEAILYTVKVESRDRRGVLTFWATAVFGNLGAYGMQFRLVREGGRWVPEPTGMSVVS
jgi:hypothetical protein